MKIKYRDEKEIGFLCVYAIYIFVYLLNSSMLQLNKLLEYVTVVAAIVLILLFLLKRKYKKREFFIGVLSFIVFAFAAHSTGKDQLLLFVLFIVCSSMASWKKILKVSLGTIICSLVCIFNAVNSGVQ